MTFLWSQLPEYETPPVVETVLAVKFRSIAGLDAVNIVRFWLENLRDGEDSFPRSQIRPPYDMPIERFDAGPNQLPGNLIQLISPLQGFPPSRFWFTSDDEEELVQMQHDWIAFNWRKQPNSDYKRYSHGLERFRQIWTKFTTFVSENDLGALVPVQCEITYINSIAVADGVWKAHGDGALVSNLIGKSVGLLPTQEGININSHYIAKDESGAPSARFYVQMSSGFQTGSNEPIFSMNLTFRGRPLSDDYDGVKRFFDLGHNWVVGGFDELTTEQMHDVWNRTLREEGT
jgi:uncharacterized protein (TIGR04255 family)